MNSKNVKGRGKRFIASFLAVLMVVTMLPVNALSVAYAEEPDVITTEVTDGIVVADDETETADSVVVTDDETEATDEDAIIEEETPQVNEEETEPEDGLVSDEANLALEETADEVAEDVIASDEPLYEAITTGILTTDGDTTIWDFSSVAGDGTKQVTGYEFAGGLKVMLGDASNNKILHHANKYLSLGDGGIIGIPLKSNTDYVTISILYNGLSDNRYIILGDATVDTNNGVGGKTKQLTHKVEIDATSKIYDSTKDKDADIAANGYGLEYMTVAKNSGNADQRYLKITAKDESKINKITITEIAHVDKTDLSVEATKTAVAITKGGQTATDATYTGDDLDLGVNVTIGENADLKDLTKDDYDIEWQRKGTDDTFAKTEDLISAGTIKAKVTGKGRLYTGTKESAEFTINKATYNLGEQSLTVDSVSDLSAAKIFDLSGLFEDVEGSIKYTLNESDNAYTLGDVLTAASIADDSSVLSYTVAGAAVETNYTKATLPIKVEFANYNDLTFNIVVDMIAKIEITFSITAKEHTYNGAAYGFANNVEIAGIAKTESGATEFTAEEKAAVETNIKKYLSYAFAEKTAPAPETPSEDVQEDVETNPSVEPIHAGEYTVTATLGGESAYTIAAPVTTTLKINPKKIKIKPIAKTWNKTTAKTTPQTALAAVSDYTFEPVDGEEAAKAGLVGEDRIQVQPTFTYYPAGTAGTEGATPMTAADWSALTATDTVDIMPSAAEAEVKDDYEISYEKGILTVEITPVTALSALTEDSSFTATNVKDSFSSTSDSTTEVKYKGFIITPGFQVDNTATGSYTNRLKSGGAGDQTKKSIGFKIDNPATLTVVAASSSSSASRKMTLSKLNADNNTVTECVGTKYKVGTGDETEYSEANKLPIGTSATTITVTLATAGTYYIYSDNNGINFLEVRVALAEDPNKVTKPTFTSPTVAEGATDYTFPTTKGKVEIGADADATVYYVLSKDADKYAAFTGTEVTAFTTNGTPYNKDTGIEITATEAGANGVSIKAVAVKNDKVSEVATSPVYKVGTMDTLAGTVTDTQDPTGAINVNDTVKVTLAYTKASGEDVTEANVKYIYTVGTGTVADPAFSALPANTVATGTQNYDSATGIAIPTSTAGTVSVKVLAYTESSNQVTAIATSPVTFTYTVTAPGSAPAMPTATVNGAAVANNGSKTVTGSATVVLAATDADIYYTTNGTTPDSNSSKYTTGFSITATTTIKAIAINANGNSGVLTFTVTVDSDGGDDIMEDGMYVKFVNGKDYTYTGNKIEPKVEVYNNGNLLTLGTDYTVKYKNNVNVPVDGAAANKLPSVTVTGKGSYSGAAEAINFTIKKAKIEDMTFADSITVIENTKVAPVIMNGAKKLTAKDYTLSGTGLENGKYAEATAEGASNTLTVTGAGNNYEGTDTIAVTVISKETARNNKIAVKVAKYTPSYGTEIDWTALTTKAADADSAIITVTAKSAENALVYGTDFDIVPASDTVNAGTVKFAVIGKGVYTGTVNKSFKISPIKAAKEDITIDFTDKDYEFKSTGVTVENLSVTYKKDTTDEKVLVPNVDYKVSYVNNKKVSGNKKAAVKVTFLGNFKGSKADPKEFTIVTAKMDAGEDGNTVVVVPDQVYTKANKAYKSTPIVTVDGVAIKASNYTVAYAWKADSAAADADYTDGNKVTLGETDKYAEVKVTITPKATASYAAAQVNGTDSVIEGTYYVRKTGDGVADLSKAKVELVDKDGTKIKALNYNGKAFYTPDTAGSTDPNAVYVKVTPKGSTEALSSSLYEVTWTNATEKGKATVVVTGTGVAVGDSSAVGSKNVSISIKPMALRGETLKNSLESAATRLKNFFQK